MQHPNVSKFYKFGLMPNSSLTKIRPALHSEYWPGLTACQDTTGGFFFYRVAKRKWRYLWNYVESSRDPKILQVHRKYEKFRKMRFRHQVLRIRRFCKTCNKSSPRQADSTFGFLCLDSKFPVKRLAQRWYVWRKENDFTDLLRHHLIWVS